MRIALPELSLVVLVGASGCGKSTFARRHFAPFEVLSSDYCRALVSNDENDQTATRDAFDVLHAIASKRLARGLLTVIDATSVQADARARLIGLARAQHVQAVAIVFDPPAELCQQRNRTRAERSVAPRVIGEQVEQLRASIDALGEEGFSDVIVLRDPAQVDAAVVEREPLPVDRRNEHGPFDVIGDVHGCSAELIALLRELGYAVRLGEGKAPAGWHIEPPAGRAGVFVGDLVDRGPDTPGVLRIVMSMVETGSALCVQGNHDAKLVKALRGRNVQVKNGLGESLEQLSRESDAFRARVADFLDALVSHYVFDDGRLVVAHGGLAEHLQGRVSPKVRAFALFGDPTGAVDDFGLPRRRQWAATYRGRAAVVYGHTPVAEAEWLNNTIDIDTGCVFGGRLTALRWPERELVSVPAERQYATPKRPFLPQSSPG